MAPFVGIQISPISLIDEGVDHVLDFLSEKAGVNALMLASHSFDYAHVGRAGEAYPDHGVHERYNITGGSFFTPHPERYRGTILPPFRAPDPDLAGTDIIELALKATGKRGMQVYPWIYENPYGPIPSIVPNWVKVAEIDCYGRLSHNPCFNNPDYRNWWVSIVEDIVSSYDVPGFMWGSERYSPLTSVFGHPAGRPSTPTCFCPHCRAQAREVGVDADRAREGYQALWELCEAARKPGYTPPTDGQFVTFWRTLVQYPEVLQWERLWVRTRREFRGALYGAAKAIRPSVEIGWHLWYLNSVDPFFRAVNDYAEFATYSDFIKPVVYNNPNGIRFKRHLETLQQTLFAGAATDTLAEFLFSQLGISEGPMEGAPERGWSADYVYRETKRSVDAVSGRCKVYAGVGINIPAGAGNKQTTPDDAREAIAAAARAGAGGLVLSRQYAEMFTANLIAAGEAIAQWPRT